jgi:hypothetical protein
MYEPFLEQLDRSLSRSMPSKTDPTIHCKISISTLCTYNLSLQTALQFKTGTISSFLPISILTCYIPNS